MVSTLRALLLVVSLSVALSGCGGGGSGSSERSQLSANSAPVANAGSAARNVSKGSSVALDGSGSSDADGDSLTYRWTLLSRPTGSGAVLNNPAVVNPVFVADLAGTYVVELTVNDGKIDSQPVQVTVRVAPINTSPVADAGINQSVVIGSLVTLNGTNSIDLDGNPLSYSWILELKPAGSTAQLTDATSATPTFTADLPGSYLATLVVNDGLVTSPPVTVHIDAFNAGDNAIPVANPGRNMNILAGTQITLDGSGSSDAGGDTLSYAWVMTGKPAGSSAVLLRPDTVNPAFTADLPGTYTVALTVSDGKIAGNTATVTVTAVTALAQLITAVPLNSEVVIGGNVQAGATFTYTLKNPSDHSFQVVRAELLNGTTVNASTTDPTFLNGGSLNPGETLGVTVTLNTTRPDLGFRFVYYLIDTVSGQAFTITHDFTPTSVTP